MNYSKYQYVITVAETRSISRAAKELYLSQPALTKCINKLEEELGVKLFQRNVIPITLTYAGERFVEEAKKILEIKNRLDKELEEISDMKKGRLTIGVSASRGEGLLPFVLPVFMKKYPGIEVKVIEGSYIFLEEQLEKELIDLALMASPITSKEIDVTVLQEERILLVASEHHHLIEGVDVSRNSLDNLLFISPEKLSGEAFISNLPGQGLTRIMNMILDLHDIKPNIILETQSVDTAYKLAAANIGLAFVPETVVSCHFPGWLPVLCTVDQTPMTRKAVVAYKKGSYLSMSANAFIEVTKEVMSGDCPKFRHLSQQEFECVRKDPFRYSPLKGWMDSGWAEAKRMPEESEQSAVT